MSFRAMSATKCHGGGYAPDERLPCDDMTTTDGPRTVLENVAVSDGHGSGKTRVTAVHRVDTSWLRKSTGGVFPFGPARGSAANNKPGRLEKSASGSLLVMHTYSRFYYDGIVVVVLRNVVLRIITRFPVSRVRATHARENK